MRRFLHIVLIFLSIQSNAQTILWEKQWTKGNDETAEIIKLNRDSTFIVSGAWSDGHLFYPSFFLNIDKSGNILWDTLGRKLQTGEQDIVERLNGGFLFTASNADTSNNKSTVFLQKLSAGGDTSTWINYPNNYDVVWPNKIISLPGGEYAIAGSAEKTSTINLYYFLQKIDSSGNVLWHKQYANYAYQCDLLLNKKGNFVISGMNATNTIPSFHPYLIEVSPQGDSLQSKLIILNNVNQNELNNRLYNNLIQTSDGGYAFSGYTVDSNNYSIGFIAKTDSAFNLKWTYFHNNFTPSGVHTAKIKELSDSSIVLLGNDDSGPNFFVLRVNKDGQFISRKLFTSSIATSTWMYDWTFLNDSSIVVCGAGDSGAYLARIGNVGAPFIEQDTCKNFVVSFTASQQGDSITFFNTSNGGYAWANQSIWKFSDSTIATTLNPKMQITGTVDSIWAKLTATNPYGCTGTVAKKVKVTQVVTAVNQNAVSYSSLSVTVFPNPFAQSTLFKVNNNFNSSYQLKILNALGEENSSYNFSGNQFTLNASNFSSGLYLYVLRDGEGKMKSGKLVVE